jgi:hypothetical protein
MLPVISICTLVSSAICIIDGIPLNLKIIEPDSASLTWIGLFVCEDSWFAREEVEEKKKKIDIRVEVTAKER